MIATSIRKFVISVNIKQLFYVINIEHFCLLGIYKSVEYLFHSTSTTSEIQESVIPSIQGRLFLFSEASLSMSKINDCSA